MKIAALKSEDKRSPIHSDTVKSLIDLGVEIYFEEGIGSGINLNDSVFEEIGILKKSRDDCLKNGDLIITNQSLSSSELEITKKNSTVLGMVNPFSNQDFIKELSLIHI